MGGCRCSYRNCTVRSDGKTHLFHYPVFDKSRCREWILNARKKELLTLTVGQVKNRVICQHHFKEDQFMNELKNNLTWGAIPTENGPYCTDRSEPLVVPSYLFEIDVTPMTYNKNKSRSEVYEDFLNDKKDITIKNDITQKLIDESQLTLEGNMIGPDALPSQDVKPPIIKLEKKTVNKNYDKPKSPRVKILSQTIIPRPTKMKSMDNILDITKHDLSQDLDNIIQQNVATTDNENVINTDSKIEDNTMNLNKEQYKENAPNPTGDELVIDKELKNHRIARSRVKTHKKVAVLKPESKATIAVNRNCNRKIMLLKSKSISNVDLSNLIPNLCAQTSNSQHSDVNVNSRSEQLILNKEPEFNIRDELEHMLKSSLQNIEQSLLGRICENTREIAELKKTVGKSQKRAHAQSSTSDPTPKPSLLKTRDTVATQTEQSKKDHKKGLFQQISEYISEELKSRLYEELFLAGVEKNTMLPDKGRRSKRLRRDTSH